MKILSLILLFFAILWLAACTCRNADCANPETVHVSFTDAQGTNLYAIGDYDADSLQISRICTCGSVEPFPKRDEDGTKRFAMDIEPRFAAYIFRHNAMEIDTLVLHMDLTESRCCGDVAELRTVTYRGREIEVSALDNLVIRK